RYHTGTVPLCSTSGSTLTIDRTSMLTRLSLLRTCVTDPDVSGIFDASSGGGATVRASAQVDHDQRGRDRGHAHERHRVAPRARGVLRVADRADAAACVHGVGEVVCAPE